MAKSLVDPVDNSNAMITLTFSWYLMIFDVTFALYIILSVIYLVISAVYAIMFAIIFLIYFINYLYFYPRPGRYLYFCSLSTSIFLNCINERCETYIRNDQISIYLFLNCINERCKTYIGKYNFENVYIIINIYASIHFVHSYYIELFVTGIISTLIHRYLNNISVVCKYYSPLERWL